MTGLNVGDKVTVDVFLKGDVVSITGISKGKGFQGVMKDIDLRAVLIHMVPCLIGLLVLLVLVRIHQEFGKV